MVRNVKQRSRRCAGPGTCRTHASDGDGSAGDGAAADDEQRVALTAEEAELRNESDRINQQKEKQQRLELKRQKTQNTQSVIPDSENDRADGQRHLLSVSATFNLNLSCLLSFKGVCISTRDCIKHRDCCTYTIEKICFSRQC